MPASKTNRSLRKEQTSEQELGKNWIPTWQSKKSSVLERKNLCAAKPVFLASDSPLFLSGNFSCETQTWNPRAGRRREKLGLEEADEKHEPPTFCCHCSLPAFTLPLLKKKADFPVNLPDSLQAPLEMGQPPPPPQLVPLAAVPGIVSDPFLVAQTPAWPCLQCWGGGAHSEAIYSIDLVSALKK